MDINSTVRNILGFLRLTHEKEEDAIIHETIEKSVVFKGTNLWILIFAILVASVGLNMNSTAVIIGAMLISPLMGPINGLGYSIATYNYLLFRKSLKNYGFAAITGLITSWMYFLVSPISTEHSELLARTSPTIYDVLIAMFGGLAGIVAISSKNKGNVIPGVAIATALMPPLCTAGYGLAMANWGYFFGAMYLFLINTVFMALASLLVSQFLKLPKKTHLLSREIKNKNIAIASVIILTVVPSVYLGYTLVVKEEFVQKAEAFVQKVGVWEGNYLLSKTIDGSTKEIHLIYGGSAFDERSERLLKEKAIDLGLDDAKLIVEQGIKIEDINDLQTSNTEYLELQNKLSKLQLKLDQTLELNDSLRAIPAMGASLLSEIKPMYPVIHSCTYFASYQYVDSTQKAVPIDVVIFKSDSSIAESDKLKIERWLKSRLKRNNVLLKF